MTRSKVLSLAFMAMFAVMALASASASAANPKILDETASFSATSGATVFGSGLTQIKSNKDKGSGKGTSEKAGSFTNVFEGSKDVLGRTCTGLLPEDQAIPGNVTVKGTYDVRYWGLSKGEKNVAILFLLEPVHLSCGETLVKVKGCVAGQIAAPYNKLTKELQIKLVVENKDNVPIKVDNAGNTAEENCELTGEVEDTSPTLSSESGTEVLTFTNSLGKAKDEVEVVA